MYAKGKNTGSAVVAVVLLIIVALVILSIARYFWVDSANEYFDKLISVYIVEKEDLAPDDRDGLKAQLLEDGLFIKMHRWDKLSFIEDRKLYNDMILTRDRRQMRKDNTGVIETLINL